MENFSLNDTEILKAVRWGRFPLFRFSRFLKNLFLSLFLFSFLFLALSVFDFVSFSSAIRMISFCFFCFISFWELNIFTENKLKKPDISFNLKEADIERDNLAEALSFEAVAIVEGAIKFCKNRKISQVQAKALLYSALENSPQVDDVFLRLWIDPKTLSHNLKNGLEKTERKPIAQGSFSEDFKLVILEALKAANGFNHERIEAKDLLIGISKTDFFKSILIDSNLKLEDFENLSLWYDYLGKKVSESRKFWQKENLAMHGSMAKDWATGYTITLDQYSIDLRKAVKRWMFKAIIGHEKELERVQEALARPEMNNVLLIGDQGSGRDSIVEGLARRVFLGKSLPELNFARVVELDMVSLLTRIDNVEEVETTLDTIFQEVITAGNIILVVKDFHNYIGIDSNQPGKVDISGIIGKYLRFPEFRFVGVTDLGGLHTKIEKNMSLVQMFTKVEVQDVSEAEVIRILQNLALELEQKYKVFVTYPAIRELINLATRYIPSVPFPKKGIDLLQDVVVYVARSKKEKVILPEHVDKVISTKTEIPIGKVDVDEKKKLLNLEKLLHERIINQEEAVKEISIAMRRARAGIGSKKRPMGTFLFLGPTGVGKTETSKALSSIYFGSEEKMIRLDMSEFQAITDIPRLIGETGQEGLLTTPVRENPFSLLLLDEIEKAHPNILNLFLQVLDEGHITDGQNRKVSFTNTIIICTSNAGAATIWEMVKNEKPLEKDALLEELFNKGTFKPEFINRFDAAVIFKPLTQENLLDIAQLNLNALKKSLKEKNVEFNVTEDLKKKIVKLSYKPAFGAREMRRVIQDRVESVIAEALLSDKLQKGDSFEISDKFELLKK